MSKYKIQEIKNLTQWLGNPRRNPKQTHGLNESDSEVIKLEPGRYLTINIDSISDEIWSGLYQEPFTLGWMTVQASLSDLAAVGSEPIGILFSAQWGVNVLNEFKQEVSRGLQSALDDSNTYLLGGDTGVSSSTVLTGVAVGIREENPISRIGIKPDDYICITGKSGRGPVLAFEFLKNKFSNIDSKNEKYFLESYYRPKAQLNYGKLLSKYSHSMIDTSDGILSSLYTLQVLNEIGFDLEWNEDLLDPLALDYCKKNKIPFWLLWIGEHGDFQLISAIPPNEIENARKICPEIHVIGRATKKHKKATISIINKNAIEFDISKFISLGIENNLESIYKKFENWTNTLNQEGFP